MGRGPQGVMRCSSATARHQGHRVGKDGKEVTVN